MYGEAPTIIDPKNVKSAGPYSSRLRKFDAKMQSTIQRIIVTPSSSQRYVFKLSKRDGVSKSVNVDLKSCFQLILIPLQ